MDFTIRWSRKASHMVRLGSLLYACTLVASNVIVTEPAKGAPPTVPDGAKTKYIIQEGTRSWKLACAAEGERPLLITWTKDGESITSAWPRFKQANEAKNLQIKNVALEDAGIYRCRAANGFGSVEVEYTVVVLAKNQMVTSSILDEYSDDDFSPPDLSELPLSSLSNGVSRAPFWIDSDPASGPVATTAFLQPVGGHVKLRCHAAGLPKPDIIWLKDGKEMDDSAFGWSRGKWALHLKDLRESDSGTYTCKIFNIWGSLNASFVIKVQGDDSGLPQFEQFHPLNTTVSEGQSATFHCRVRSQEKPVLQWIKVIEDPSHLDFNQSVEVHGLHITVLDRKLASDTVDFRNSTYSKLLYIPFAKASDAGWYVCVVTSQKGHLSHRFAYLNVVSAYERHTPVSEQPLPLHIVVGIPVAFVLLLLVGYAIYFLQTHQQKPPTTASSGTTQGANSTNSTAASSTGNGQHPPPPPSYPPPSLPPPSSHKTSPPRGVRAILGAQGGTQNYTPSSSDHSSSAQQQTILQQQQQQPLLKENGYVPGLLSPPQAAAVYKPDYKSYRLDPQMMAPLNGQCPVPVLAAAMTGTAANQASNGGIAYEAGAEASTPQPYELRYDDSELSDSCYDANGNGQMQHYPSLYSCR